MRLLLIGIACLSLVPVIGDEKPVLESITGKVVGVTDGDTITVLVTEGAKKTQLKVRLEGIDAPEAKQSFGGRAKQALSRLVYERTVTIKKSGEDRYGRTLGWLIVQDANINEQLLRDGWAWHYKKYNQDERLAELETEARNAKRGLWADRAPMAPWDFRSGSGRSGADPFADIDNDDRSTTSDDSRKSDTEASGPRETAKKESSSSSAKSKERSKPDLSKSYWLNTSSNVRHNRSCQHFGTTKKGHYCGSDEGRACGICGG